MTEVNDVLSEEQLNKVESKIGEDGKPIQCDTVFEDDPTVQYIGAGLGRCAFITNTDNILKVARTQDGVIDNRRASNIFLVNDELAEKTFARPVDVHKSGIALLQEEVELMDDLPIEEVKRRIDKPESLKKTTLSQSQLIGVAESNMEEKLDKVAEEEGIRCLDIVDENLGVKRDKGVVMADLGQCKLVEELAENKGVRQDYGDF